MPLRLAPASLATLLVALLALFHFCYAGWLPLSPQEAYYWQWARHLDLSYYDHPPLAAWTITLCRALFGDGERVIRLAAGFHSTIFALFFFLSGRRLFGARVAWWTIAVSALMPLFSMGQLIITPDGPLLSGWAITLYCTVRFFRFKEPVPSASLAINSNDPLLPLSIPWLFATAAAVGWACLGKYTGALLAPQILILLLADPRGRQLLLKPWPYLALLLTLAIFSPVLLWNSRHDYISFAFQFALRLHTESAFNLRRVGSFLGLQLAGFSPLLCLALWGSLVAAARRWREPAMRVVAVFSLPTLLFFALSSPFTWVKFNWLIPCYPTALLAAVVLFNERAEGPKKIWLRRYAFTALALSGITTIYLHLVPFVAALPFPAKDEATRGWKELALRVEQERALIGPDNFVLGCFYKTASTLAYYLPDRPETFSGNSMNESGLNYQFWSEPGALSGKDGILVLDQRDYRWCVERSRFCHPLIPLPSLEIRRGRDLVTRFDLWRCHYAPELAQR